jgi:hypothetical protein
VPPALVFWHPLSQNGTVTFQYQTASPLSRYRAASGIGSFVHSDTRLTGCRTVRYSSPALIKTSLDVHTASDGLGYNLHVHTVGGRKGYALPSILQVVKRCTPCISILLAVERATPCMCILLAVGRGSPCTSILLVAVVVMRYTLHIQTKGSGKCYNRYIHRRLSLVFFLSYDVEKSHVNARMSETS